MAWESVVYTREDLFRQVWDEPVTHVAKRIGISDVALAKACRRMGIPLPGRGYWARKAAGYAPSPPHLKPPKAGMPASYVRHRFEGDSTTAAGDEIRAEVARQAMAEPTRPVPEVLEDPHPLVARAFAILQRAERRLGDVLYKHRCLDISAQGPALDRACRIMDTVLRELEARGHSIEVTAPTAEGQQREPSRTLVAIGDSSVQIGIDEAVDKIPLPLPEPRKPRGPFDYVPRPKREYEYRPTGRLRLRIKNVSLRGAPEMWGDRRGVLVESHLGEFVASVMVAAERQRLDRIEAEERRQAELRAARRREAIEIHNDADEVLEKDLEGRMKDWKRARHIEAFASAVRERVKSAGRTIEAESTVGKWLKWTGVVVEYYDREAIDQLTKLRREHGGYKLRSRFDWSHELAMDDALDTFFMPIEDLVKELDLKAQSREGQS